MLWNKHCLLQGKYYFFTTSLLGTSFLIGRLEREQLKDGQFDPGRTL